MKEVLEQTKEWSASKGMGSMQPNGNSLPHNYNQNSDEVSTSPLCNNMAYILCGCYHNIPDLERPAWCYIVCVIWQHHEMLVNLTVGIKRFQTRKCPSTHTPRLMGQG